MTGQHYSPLFSSGSVACTVIGCIFSPRLKKKKKKKKERLLSEFCAWALEDGSAYTNPSSVVGTGEIKTECRPLDGRKRT